MSLTWTKKNDFFPHFLYKEARAKGSQLTAQGLWRDHVEETALTCTTACMQIFKERTGGKRTLVFWLQILGSFPSTSPSASQKEEIIGFHF